MPYLDVPGARLHFDTQGTGPLLVMVPGAAGVADVFRPLSDQLSGGYTVVVYDRRGFGRSELTQPPPADPGRLETDADDVRRLVEHLGGGPATVFGSSSGAIVALTALTRHPDMADTIIAHEPPAMRLLPDGQRWLDFFRTIYGTYREEGVEAALTRFRERTFPPGDAQAMTRAPIHPANAAFWFEHELRQYPAVLLDVDAPRRYADRVIPAAGATSTGYPCHRAAAALATLLDRRLVELPGGHIGFLTDPAPFAHILQAALRAADLPGGTR